MVRVYVLYDERALEDVDGSTVLESFLTWKEARERSERMAPCVCYSYEVIGKEFLNGRYEWYTPTRR